MTGDFLNAVDELLQALATGQSRSSQRHLAEVYDERTIERMTNEARAAARGLRARHADRQRKARDAQSARAGRSKREGQ